MKLLVDHNLSPAIPRSLQHLYPTHEFAALSDKFPADTTDIDWMAELDREGGWAVLTKDLRIQFRPHERLALDRSKIVFFFLPALGANMLCRRQRHASSGLFH